MTIKKIYLIQMFNAFGELKGFVCSDGKISTEEFDTRDLANRWIRDNPDKLKSGYYYIPVEGYAYTKD